MYSKRQAELHNAAGIDDCDARIRTALTTDVKGIESVSSVGAVFEKVFLGLGELFTGFIFSETEAAAFDAGRLDCENKIIVILAVEIRHEAVASGEATVDKVILFIVAHGIAERNRDNAPTVALEFLNNGVSEIDIVDGIVAAESRSIIVEDYGLIVMIIVILAELGN